MSEGRGYHGLSLRFGFRDGFQIVLFGDRDHRRVRNFIRCVQSNTSPSEGPTPRYLNKNCSAPDRSSTFCDHSVTSADVRLSVG